MVGLKRGKWFVRARHSEQHFADFAVPTDTVVYLTQNMPITDGRVNNTAGYERSSSIYLRYGGKRFSSALSLSNAYQKAGFYPGAHGIPDPSRVVDDGNIRNIDLPYNSVNHFKASLLNRYWWDRGFATWNVSYQSNQREEWSLFHTHYSGQEMPTVDPDLEIALTLQNLSSNMSANFNHSERFESTVCLDLVYQENAIGGYSFLLPSYRRATLGAAWVGTYRPSERWIISGGVRYDGGYIDVDKFYDDNLVEYLSASGYSDSVIEQNGTRSYALNRCFNDYSLSLGAVWSANTNNTLRFNVGRSFRLPTANELAANGVHHSSFRHEQGDPTLDSERGWQVDFGYSFRNEYSEGRFINLNFSPYASWYSSYIYLQPTGLWSVLPHAGQIYRYMQCEAFFAGGEVSFEADLPYGFGYDMSAEYAYTYNIDERIPMTFTPPTTMRNNVSWSRDGVVRLSAGWQCVAAQNRVSRNEDRTPGAQLFNASAMFELPFISKDAYIVLSVDNIFDTKYLNHLSYYRQIEIPEPGRNFQLFIKIPF